MQFNQNDFSAVAYFYDEIKDLHRVEVSFFGMAITNIQVKQSPKHPELGKWVDMPAYKAGEGWKKVVRFEKDSPLLSSVEAAARKAAEEYGTVDKTKPTPPTEMTADGL